MFNYVTTKSVLSVVLFAAVSSHTIPAIAAEKSKEALNTSTQVNTATKQSKDIAFNTMESLGAALYFDVNFSINRNQSCATCHNPAKAFIDDRANALNGAVSIGSDGESIGDRNTPTASYASFAPDFYQDKEGEYVGGMFHDGRAASLKEQAEGPPLNLGEMAMPSKQDVLNRLLENEDYIASFSMLFDEKVLTQSGDAFAAMSKAISVFEKTPFFSSFDSKYDRYLAGEYEFSDLEKLGETIFFSQQFTNCNQCHQLKRLPGQGRETFSNYQYHNIGVPINKAVRLAAGKDDDFIDHGLLENPLVDDVKQDGKFKVPTLRNVAVSGPYMHNGVFSDLKTVVLFYDKYNSRKKIRQINPETQDVWAEPEVAQNIALDKLTIGKALTDQRVDALVAFMLTLTDRKYEYLLPKTH
jgi:cytochrome c peroxidase